MSVSHDTSTKGSALAPAWHTVGHVWTAASHGCLRGLENEIFGSRGPDAAMGLIAALCPHAEFAYGGAVAEAIGAIHARQVDHASIDWTDDWERQLRKAIHHSTRSCVFGGEPLDPNAPLVDGLRRRMTDPQHFAALQHVAETLSRDSRVNLAWALEQWALQ